MTDQVESKFQKGVEEKRKLRKLEDDEEYDCITIPPDGGFGWVVLVACFVSYYVDFVLYNVSLLLSLLSL
jgi:hypothetical protein